VAKNIIIKAKIPYSRIDIFINESIKDISRSKIEKLIKNNKVKLNNNITDKKNRGIQIGDVVEIELPEIVKKSYYPSFKLKKLFEDNYLLIIDKPSGISVHPGAGIHKETILDVFRYYYPEINSIKNEERPGIIHRIDKDTSGILLLAKHEITMRQMQKKFKKREIKKSYFALVSGKMRFKNGTINTPIARDHRKRNKFKVSQNENIENSRDSVTEYSVIYEFENCSFVKVFPHTGRTHQIRVHFSSLGNPILGDKIYGNPKSFKRLALHAYSIKFHHPIHGNLITSYSPLPEIFRKYIQEEFLKQ
jgi:23S rRNA pseudouridine1911/1915/1917 synthase